jgi:predicted ArsR family transcriptional regulator
VYSAFGARRDEGGREVDRYKNGGRSLNDLGEILGDPTRRSILQYVLNLSEPVTAKEVSEVFGVHRTVARGHLERLLASGLLKAETRPAVTGYGRPAKIYSASGDRLEFGLPPRRYEALARLLLHIVRSLLPTDMAVHHAHAAGYDYGVSVRRDLQGIDDGRLSPEAACAWLAQEGYAARCARGHGCDVFTFDNCVFREVADDAPEIACAFSRGMLCGLVGAAAEDLTQTNDMVRDGFCRHVIKE